MGTQAPKWQKKFLPTARYIVGGDYRGKSINKHVNSRNINPLNMGKEIKFQSNCQPLTSVG